MADKGRHVIQQEVSKRLMKRFLVHIVLYMFLIAVITVAGWAYCSSHVWYEDDAFYGFIHFVHYNLAETFLFILCFGIIVIACVHFFVIASMLGRVTDEVDLLYSGQKEFAKLPEQLTEMEEQLNRIMHNVRKSRNEADEAVRRKNDMIVYMAHDLKTPLTSVMGYLSLVRDEDNLPQEIRKKYLDIAIRKTERLEDLINEFFEVARYNFSHMILEYSTVNLSVMLEQILYEFKPVFGKKGLDYKTDIEPDIMISCDIEKMERVFDNLFRNVVSYSYNDTDIEVSLKRKDKDEVRFIVENSGKTIPKEKLDCIFEQFFRLDSSRSSQTGGAGLGLAIVKEIVNLHHGNVMCESADEKIRFTIDLKIK